MPVGAPDFSPRLITSATADEHIKVSVTDTEQEVVFTRDMLAFLIYNDGPNPVHYSRATGVTTTNFMIPSKSWLMLDIPTRRIYLICATGQIATCYILGVW